MNKIPQASVAMVTGSFFLEMGCEGLREWGWCGGMGRV